MVGVVGKVFGTQKLRKFQQKIAQNANSSNLVVEISHSNSAREKDMGVNPWAQGSRALGPWALRPMGAFWEGRGLESVAHVGKISDFGTLKRIFSDSPDLPETVAAGAARTPPPHAPGARMTVVNKLPQTTDLQGKLAADLCEIRFLQASQHYPNSSLL